LTVVLSIYCLIFALIIGIDLEQRLILNRVLIPAAAFALLAAPSLPEVGLLRAIAGGGTGFLLLLLVAALSRGGMGGGDVKLAGFLGLVTGFPDILASLAAGIFLGGATVVLLLLLRRVGPKDYVAYGPFLVAGAILRLALW
jgi:Flp pilus assembly protein protease CpaA